MNKIVALVVTAVVGVVLSVLYGHPSGNKRNGAMEERSWTRGAGGGGSGFLQSTPWEEFPRAGFPRSLSQKQSPDGSGATPDKGHELDTRSTVYVDGDGQPRSGGSPEMSGGMFGLLAPLVEGASQSLALARKASEQDTAHAGSLVPAGTVLRGQVMHRLDGPGGGSPVFVLISPQTVGHVVISSRMKMMGYPVGLSRDHRLMMRFNRVIYSNGLESQMTGYAMEGGREGVVVSVSRHAASQFAGSLAQNTLMMGGDAIGYMGYGNAGVGTDMALQAAGATVGSGESILPYQNPTLTYRLAAGTPVSIMILHGFPPAVAASEPR